MPKIQTKDERALSIFRIYKGPNLGMISPKRSLMCFDTSCNKQKCLDKVNTAESNH